MPHPRKGGLAPTRPPLSRMGCFTLPPALTEAQLLQCIQSSRAESQRPAGIPRETTMNLPRMLIAALLIISTGCGSSSSDTPADTGTGSAVAVPTFSPAAGSYSAAQNVTIDTATVGASIRYTTDGSTPTETVGTVYAAPVHISATLTLKAVAYRTGWTTSTVTTGAYTIPLVYKQFAYTANS